jgi:D-glucuronyl C5-epimerase C-terminus
MWGRAALVAAGLALLSGSASAQPGWVKDVQTATRGLDRAVAAGRLVPDEAAEYKATLNRAARVLPKLPSSRYRNLAAVLHQVASLTRVYDEPRALTLFSMLDFNVRWYSARWDRPGGTDVQASDGMFYRQFSGRGFQFHPLANFGKLNWFVTSRQGARAQQLALALLERAVPDRGGLGWEYYFGFGGGRPPWLSGMGQAVAAQALARAGAEVGAPELTDAARRAFVLVPRLVRGTVRGPWIRLYSFSPLAVLNAQLQTLVSLGDYVTAAGDPAAQAFAARLQNATTGLIRAFDTGYWSLYSLGGAEATLHYHRYVVRLLSILSNRTKDPVLMDSWNRFRKDLTEPPVLKPGAAPPPTLYPWPVDGFRDDAQIRVWLSKRSSVRLDIGTRRIGSVLVSRGWHTVSWKQGPLAPGRYPAALHAVDPAGNASDTDVAPLEVRQDTRPPRVSARLRGSRLIWRALDGETPWVRLTLVLASETARRTLALGVRPLHGTARFRLPRGTWAVTLVSSDSSGNTAKAPLGVVRRRG